MGIEAFFYLEKRDVDKEWSIAYHLISDKVSSRRNYGKSDI